jgi:membrane protein DedA with SNARE-associated domain
LARLVPGLRAMTMPLAGSTRMPWTWFLLYDADGVVLWVLAYALQRAASAHRWPALAPAVQSYQTTFLFILAMAPIGILGYRGWQRMRHRPTMLITTPSSNP